MQCETIAESARHLPYVQVAVPKDFLVVRIVLNLSGQSSLFPVLEHKSVEEVDVVCYVVE